MSATARRLAALDALARDQAATDAERRLAAQHAARLRAVVGSAAETYVAVECDNVLVEAFDRAMKAAASVRHPSYRAARIRRIKLRAGAEVVGEWERRRGQAITR